MQPPDDTDAFRHFMEKCPKNAAHYVAQQAQDELNYEKFRKRVEEKKIEFLTRKSFWSKLFPYRLNIERIK
jgi:hypothetical protein